MTIDEHALLIGQIVVNFHTLESLLRSYLQSLPSATPSGLPLGTSVCSLPVGSVAPVNEFTNQDGLGQLIERFNREMAKRSRKPLDATVVAIRDALAHGRMSVSSRDGELFLMRFTKLVGGKVVVTFNQKLDYSWFNRQKAETRAAIEQVLREF